MSLILLDRKAKRKAEKKAEKKVDCRLSERSLMLLRLLPRTVGELSDDLKTQINQLSIEKLDALTELFLDFTDLNDLVNWLQNTPD